MEEGHFPESSQSQDNQHDIPDKSKVKRSRGRVANPENWVTNKRRKNKVLGLAYLDSKGNLKPERRLRPKDCSKCPKKCNQSFTEEERQKIYKTYWEMPDMEKKRIFVSNLVEEAPVASRTVKGESRRSCTRSYFLRNGKKKISVCQGFFLATLDLSQAFVRRITETRDEATNFPKPDGRGKSTSAHARPEHVKDRVRQHIRSFFLSLEEAGPSIKKKHKKADQDPSSDDMIERVLPAGMNIKRMYDSYVDQCQWSSTVPEKQWLYREIVKNEFNIIFTDPLRRKEKDTTQARLNQEVVEQYPPAGYSNYGYGYP